VNVRLQPPHASLIGGDRRNRPSSLVKFAAMGRASSRVSRFGRRATTTQRYVRNRGKDGSVWLALETTLKTIPEVEQGCPSIISGQALTPACLQLLILLIDDRSEVSYFIQG
jgi:hypothetical protein